MAKLNKIAIFIIVMLNVSAYAQDYRYGYLVEFKDKTNTPFSIDNPEAFLSERAIQRREKWNIEITEQDLPVDPAYVSDIVELDGVFHVSSKWLNSAVFYTDNSNFIEKVSELDFVKATNLVYESLPVKKNASQSKWVNTVNDAYYGESFNQMMMLNAKELHHRGFSGEGLHIAVLDGGFWRVNELSCFQKLWDNNQILGTYDFINHNKNVFDDHTHGMGVLSIMASYLPEEFIGSAIDASYYLYRTENVYSEYLIEEENWIAGAEKADSAGADIITASLGYSIYDNPDMSHTYQDMDGKSTRITQGAEIAFTKGMFIVNSAGNEGNNEWYHITAPSDGENVLCIGAVDEFEELAFFSSKGPSADGRVKPDVVAKGLGTTLIKSDGTVGFGNGTSYSCPVMAGMVACLWQALPSYSNKELLKLLRDISDKSNSPDHNYGYGLPDFSKVSLILDAKENIDLNSGELTNVYPIPFADELSFQFYSHKKQTAQVVITNVQGQEMYAKHINLDQQSLNTIELDNLSHLSSGCYFLNVITSTEVLTRKIVRN